MTEYAVFGWFYGYEYECQPPESGKRWLTVATVEADGRMGDEIATFVQRKRGGSFRSDDGLRVNRNAEMVADALNEIRKET